MYGFCFVMQKVKKYLHIPGTDINGANSAGDTPLHCYIKSDRADKLDLLSTFLVHCNCKVLQIDKPNAEGRSALHIAVEVHVLNSMALQPENALSTFSRGLFLLLTVLQKQKKKFLIHSALALVIL